VVYYHNYNDWSVNDGGEKIHSLLERQGDNCIQVATGNKDGKGDVQTDMKIVCNNCN